MAVYTQCILCAAAFGSLEQLLDSYCWAPKQLQNSATRFKGLHSVSVARCNLTLAAKRLWIPRHCKSAANPLFSDFAALLWHCTALLISYWIAQIFETFIQGSRPKINAWLSAQVLHALKRWSSLTSKIETLYVKLHSIYIQISEVLFQSSNEEVRISCG